MENEAAFGNATIFGQPVTQATNNGTIQRDTSEITAASGAAVNNATKATIKSGATVGNTTIFGQTVTQSTNSSSNIQEDSSNQHDTIFNTLKKVLNWNLLMGQIGLATILMATMML